MSERGDKQKKLVELSRGSFGSKPREKAHLFLPSSLSYVKRESERVKCYSGEKRLQSKTLNDRGLTLISDP